MTNIINLTISKEKVELIFDNDKMSNESHRQLLTLIEKLKEINNGNTRQIIKNYNPTRVL